MFKTVGKTIIERVQKVAVKCSSKQAQQSLSVQSMIHYLLSIITVFSENGKCGSLSESCEKKRTQENKEGGGRYTTRYH